MKMFYLNFASWFNKVKNGILSFNSVKDILDVLFVALLIFAIVRIVRETRAIQLAGGVVLLSIVYILIRQFKMQASSYIFSFIFNNLLILMVVIFAPEIRHALESVGRNYSRGARLFNFGKGSAEQYFELMNNMVNTVCRAAEDFSNKRIGALLVFERDIALGDIASTGTVVDAEISTNLIGNIFYPKSPLHDGAAIIRNGRVFAAGCILPLTEKNNSVSLELGTRHRAAIGMSEKSDALVVVVSEETGAVSVAQNGRLRRNISNEELREILDEYFIDNIFTKKSRRKLKKDEK